LPPVLILHVPFFPLLFRGFFALVSEVVVLCNLSFFPGGFDGIETLPGLLLLLLSLLLSGGRMIMIKSKNQSGQMDVLCCILCDVNVGAGL